MLEKAITSVRRARGGSPHALDDGVDGTALQAGSGQEQVAGLLAVLFAEAELVARARAAASIIQALELAEKAVARHPLLQPEVKWVRRRPGSQRYVRRQAKSAVLRDVTTALGAIERAAYVNLLNTQHEGVYGVVSDTLGDIRTASRQHCVCNY